MELNEHVLQSNWSAAQVVVALRELDRLGVVPVTRHRDRATHALADRASRVAYEAVSQSQAQGSAGSVSVNGFQDRAGSIIHA